MMTAYFIGISCLPYIFVYKSKNFRPIWALIFRRSTYTRGSDWTLLHCDYNLSCWAPLCRLTPHWTPFGAQHGASWSKWRQRGASSCNWRRMWGEPTQLAPNMRRVEANDAQRGTSVTTPCIGRQLQPHAPRVDLICFKSPHVWRQLCRLDRAPIAASCTTLGIICFNSPHVERHMCQLAPRWTPIVSPGPPPGANCSSLHVDFGDSTYTRGSDFVLVYITKSWTRLIHAVDLYTKIYGSSKKQIRLLRSR